LLKVISFNANGIRSAARKGFFTWLEGQDADFIAIQELKAKEEQLTELPYHSKYQAYYHCAVKPGYSGVAILSKHKPKSIIKSLGWDVADNEGRYIELEFANLVVASIYLPSGTSSTARQELKYEFMDKYYPILQKQFASDKPYIICGDLNIAHTKLDIKNWRNNQKSSGFLPEERDWMTQVLSELGCVDAYRYLYPDKEQYTWWSNRAGSWDRNVGWRIDYQLASTPIATKISMASVYREEKFSDHAPLIINYDIKP